MSHSELAAVMFKTRQGRIYDIHAVADPGRFAALGVGGAPVGDLE
ncbi:MAG TPA: hypothetical protein VGI06_11995 [Acidimicrobiales bacterium]|jgi:hypothetical protein